MQRRLLKETRAKRRDSLHWNCAHTIANQLNCSTRPKYQHESIINTEVGKTAVVLLHPYFFFYSWIFFIYFYWNKQKNKIYQTTDIDSFIMVNYLWNTERNTMRYDILFLSTNTHTLSYTLLSRLNEINRNFMDLDYLISTQTKKKLKIESHTTRHDILIVKCSTNECKGAKNKHTKNKTKQIQRVDYDTRVLSLCFSTTCVLPCYSSPILMYTRYWYRAKNRQTVELRGERYRAICF